jgi:hypothetical protein
VLAHLLLLLLLLQAVMPRTAQLLSEAFPNASAITRSADARPRVGLFSVKQCVRIRVQW